MGWHFIIQFPDCFLCTEGLGWLNLLLDNDSHLLFVIFQTSSIAIKSWKLTCFPPPQAARVTVVSGEKGFWVVWYDSDVVKVEAQRREIRIGRILICVRVIIVLVVGINPVTVEW